MAALQHSHGVPQILVYEEFLPIVPKELIYRKFTKTIKPLVKD